MSRHKFEETIRIGRHRLRVLSVSEAAAHYGARAPWPWPVPRQERKR